MSLPKRLTSPAALLYLSIFAVTQVAGIVFSLVMCYVLDDLLWGFIRVALVNSLVLGAALIGACHLTQMLIHTIRTGYIAAIAFSLILGVAVISVASIAFYEPTLFVYARRGLIAFLVVNFLFIVALLAISSGLIVSRELMLQKERAIGAERGLRSQMEMKLLTSRVNPHFLFNTLNMILSLLKQPDKAETAVLNLSDLLRENLEQTEKTRVPIARELDNVRKYLEIQELRFGDKLRFVIEGTADFPVPPMIIQPLVENSIKHNIRSVNQLTVEVHVSQDAARNVIWVVDSERAVEESMLHKGQGLTITCQRVENSNGTCTFRDGGIELSFSR